MKKTNRTLSTALLASIFFFSAPVFALNVGSPRPVAIKASSTVAIDAKIEARITKAKERADQEIERRLAALHALNEKVQSMTRVQGEVKSSIDLMVVAEITALTTLKAKIAEDTALEDIKADVKSITAAYRIFMLVIPRGHIIVSADRIKTASESLTAFNERLTKRISDESSAGKDVSDLQKKNTDITSLIATANADATAAVTLVTPLTPDNGDKTIAASNQKALKDAREKVKSAFKSLRDARNMAHSVVIALPSLKHLQEATTTSLTP